MSVIKNFVKSHKRLLKAVLKVSGRDYMSLRFVSFNDGLIFSADWASRIPYKFDVIIGIPRSGIAIAQIIAQKHGVALSAPENFLRGELWHSKDSPKTKIENVKSVLIIEDCVSSGIKMNELKSAINQLYPKIEVSTGCLFATPQCLPWITYYYSLLMNEMRLSEWGLLSTGFVAGPLMSDLDGIICLDPKPGENEKSHASMAEPKMIPSFELTCIATARYESLRVETEQWLIANKVKFQKLDMLPDSIPKTFDNICRFKADCAKKVGACWIWESDAYQAAKLHKLTKLPVLCTSRMQLMSENPNIYPKRSKIIRRIWCTMI